MCIYEYIWIYVYIDCFWVGLCISLGASFFVCDSWIRVSFGCVSRQAARTAASEFEKIESRRGDLSIPYVSVSNIIDPSTRPISKISLHLIYKEVLHISSP